MVSISHRNLLLQDHTLTVEWRSKIPSCNLDKRLPSILVEQVCESVAALQDLCELESENNDLSENRME